MGTIFVMKLPGADIESLRGTFQIQVRHEVYAHEQAPVIRTLFRFYDQPQSPLAIETFTNIGDPVQRADFADLEKRDRLTMAFYDERVSHQLTKQVANLDREMIPMILTGAKEWMDTIPQGQVDFDKAKADVVRFARM